MLTLTPSAVEAVDSLLHDDPNVPDDAGLRIGTAGESQLTPRITREMVQAMRFPNVPASIVKDSNGKGMPVEFTFTVL